MNSAKVTTWSPSSSQSLTKFWKTSSGVATPRSTSGWFRTSYSWAISPRVTLSSLFTSSRLYARRTSFRRVSFMLPRMPYRNSVRSICPDWSLSKNRISSSSSYWFSSRPKVRRALASSPLSTWWLPLSSMYRSMRDRAWKPPGPDRSYRAWRTRSTAGSPVRFRPWAGTGRGTSSGLGSTAPVRGCMSASDTNLLKLTYDDFISVVGLQPSWAM
mmetsp:Transcript_142504/g.248597  ORF Transcript_142504/g.248597 Transcript_142504/m.248597 type:complete len:215 (+) Transcript_142504:2535-3179(+)